MMYERISEQLLSVLLFVLTTYSSPVVFYAGLLRRWKGEAMTANYVAMIIHTGLLDGSF